MSRLRRADIPVRRKRPPTQCSIAQPKMKIIPPLLCILFLLVGCGGEGSRKLTDPRQQISFEIPKGWETLPNSNGTRFHATTQEDAIDASRAIIMVNTILVDEQRDLVRQRDEWIAHHEQRGLRIVLRSTYQKNGVTGVEFANEQAGMMGQEILHQIQFHYPGVLVLTHLQVPVEDYETMLPIYHEVVRSIQPLSVEPVGR